MTEPAKPVFPTPRFGRVAIPNPGSLDFPLRAVQRRAALSTETKVWRMGRFQQYQDQGNTSHCVRYGNAHLLLLEPIVRGNALALTKGLYAWAQNNDPWPGSEPTYYGTSADAGLQFLLHEAKLIKEYRWALTMDEIITRLTLPAKDGGGPMIVGTDFYTGMDVDLTPSQKPGDRTKWVPEGELMGGHCYVLDAHRAPAAQRVRQIGIGNSHKGNHRAWIDADALEWLIFGQNGECAAVTELPK